MSFSQLHLVEKIWYFWNSGKKGEKILGKSCFICIESNNEVKIGNLSKFLLQSLYSESDMFKLFFFFVFLDLNYNYLDVVSCVGLEKKIIQTNIVSFVCECLCLWWNWFEFVPIQITGKWNDTIKLETNICVDECWFFFGMLHVFICMISLFFVLLQMLKWKINEWKSKLVREIWGWDRWEIITNNE